MLVGESGELAVSATESFLVAAYQDRGVEAERDPMDELCRIHGIFKGRAEPSDPVLAIEGPFDVPALEVWGTGMLPQTRFASSDPHAAATTRTAGLLSRNKRSNPQLAVPVTGCAAGATLRLTGSAMIE